MAHPEGTQVPVWIWVVALWRTTWLPFGPPYALPRISRYPDA